MRQFRGLLYLAWLTCRRQATAKRNFLVAGLFLMICMVTVLYVRRHDPGTDATPEKVQEEVRHFADRIVLGVYVSFLLPIVAVVYGVSVFGEEREQRTLVYLLIRPLTRWRLYLAKAAGVLPILAVAGILGFAAICWMGGRLGEPSWGLFWPAILRACVAYTALFLLFGAIVPRPAVTAIVYAFFVETMLGNMPGTIKRIAISYYCRCMMYDAGAELGLAPSIRNQFLAIDGSTAALVLDIATVVLLALGAWAFHRGEYRELT